MLPSCSVEYILHIWSCPDGPKSYRPSYLLFELLKGLLLLKAPLKGVLLLDYSVERVHSNTLLECIISLC